MFDEPTPKNDDFIQNIADGKETKQDKKNPEEFNLDEIKNKWLNQNSLNPKLVSLILGADGTSKTGIAIDALTDEDIKKGYRMLIIDVDGGCEPLLLSHHRERCEKLGRKLNDVYLVKNPLTQDFKGNIDYIQTFKNIREGIYLARNAWEDLKIKYIVFDGLSSALKFAEYTMRVEKNIAPDGGIQLRMWLIRNKIFMELLEQIKSLPISCFFIGHENFILKELGENSSIIEKTNAICHQKIICKRIDNPRFEKVYFEAEVTKSKYRPDNEGAKFKVCTVDKKTKDVQWSTKELYEALL